MTGNAVYIEQHDGWAELILNRPERKNAITGPLGVDLAACVEQLNEDEAVAAVVLRGAGGAFCSGLDLKAFNAEPAPAWRDDFQNIWRGAHRALFDCRKPLIGALERYAINGGAALALACDLLVVGEQSFLQVGEVQIGMAAPYNLAWLNLRFSEAQIASMVLLGERIDGPALVRSGIASRCVADDEVLTQAQGLAAQMAGFPSGSPSLIKSGLRARLDHDADAWFDRFANTAQSAGALRPRSMK